MSKKPLTIQGKIVHQDALIDWGKALVFAGLGTILATATRSPSWFEFVASGLVAVMCGAAMWLHSLKRKIALTDELNSPLTTTPAARP